MKHLKIMIKSPMAKSKRDRLAAFIDAFPLSVSVAKPIDSDAMPNLLLEASSPGDQFSQIRFFARGAALPSYAGGKVIAATIEFGGSSNPLLNALPECITFDLHVEPTILALTEALAAEVEKDQCGSQVIINRLVEVIVLIMLRRTIGRHAGGSGLLAGLAHPQLHQALVAVHDAPAAAWNIDKMADAAGMSRSYFIAQFRAIVGETPGAYLTAWRLALGYRRLARGESVKLVARRTGFGSAAAFSRAFTRRFGCAPVSVATKLVQIV
jgi:AraC-like DNA-binding protein